MKYWNKSKESREKWTKITVNVNFFKAKLWCQHQPGRGKFYSSVGLHKWYFENSQDALLFKLSYTDS